VAKKTDIRPWPGQLPHHVGNKDLSPIGESDEASGDHHRRSEEVLVLLDGAPAVEPDPNLKPSTWMLTVVLCDRPLDVHGASDSVHNIAEGHHEPVALGLDLMAAVFGYLFAQDGVVQAK